MENKKLFLVALTLITLASCHHRPNRVQTELEIQQTLNIDVDTITEQSLSVFFEKGNSFTLTPLATDSMCLISEVCELQNRDDRYYFIDARQKKFYCFNEQGLLEFVIDRHGRGPGEYLNLTNYTLTENGIILLDHLACKLLHYDLDGKYINDVKLSEARDYNHVILYQDSLLILTADGSFKAFEGDADWIYIFNKTGDLIARNLYMSEDYTKRIEGFSMNHSLYIFQDTIYMTLPMDNKLYSISPDRVKIRYYLDYGDTHNMDHFIIDHANLSDDEFLEKNTTKGAIMITSPFIEKNDYLLYSAIMKNNRLGLIHYDKKTDQAMIYAYTGAWLALLNRNHLFNGVEDDLLLAISALDVAPFIEYSVDTEDEKTKYVRDKLQALNIAEDQNPVIIKFKLD